MTDQNSSIPARNPHVAECDPVAPTDYLETDPDAYVSNRHDGWTGAAQRMFLEILAETGSVPEAASAVDMSEQSAYRLRRSTHGRSFVTAWDIAYRHAAQRLLAMASDRALNAREETVRSSDVPIGMRKVYNDRMLIYLINRHDCIMGGKVQDMPATSTPRQPHERLEDGAYIEVNGDAFIDADQRDGDARCARMEAREIAREEYEEMALALRRADKNVPAYDDEAFLKDEGAQGGAFDTGHTERFVAQGRALSDDRETEVDGIIRSWHDRLSSGEISDSAGMAMLDAYDNDRYTAAEDIDISDLDTDEANTWTDSQWDRAFRSGLLSTMPDSWWDEDDADDADADAEDSGNGGNDSAGRANLY